MVKGNLFVFILFYLPHLFPFFAQHIQTLPEGISARRAFFRLILIFAQAHNTIFHAESLSVSIISRWIITCKPQNGQLLKNLRNLPCIIKASKQNRVKPVLKSDCLI